MTQQLAIPLAQQEMHSYAAEDYIVSPANEAAYRQVMRWPDWPAHAVWLCGPEASGKSHLAALWQQQTGAQFLTPQTLPQWQQSNRDQQSVRCILEQAETALTDDQSAQALFHLLNQLALHDGALLLTSHQPPAKLAIPLADLRSRLLALPVARLHSPDDDLLRSVWFKQFADRQLHVSAQVVDYLMLHCERSFRAIRHHVMAIDQAAMQEKRNITIPFLKSLLPLAEDVS